MMRDPLLDLARHRGVTTAGAAGGDAEAILRAAGLGDAEIAELRLELERASVPAPIPGYRLIERVGIGAHSTVWRAQQEGVAREVAIKIIPARRPKDVERFLWEARAAGAIGSPYVVTCHEAGRSGEVLFLVMELLSGGDAESLADSLGGRVPERRSLEIVRDAARGLSALFSAGLTHRDIKPANILLTDGGAKLADLGLARDAEAPIHRTVQSSIGEGTPAFMSPEQVRGEQLDVRSDLFSLGATFYRLVTGQLPFSGRTVVETLRLLNQGPSPDPIDAAPDLTDGSRLMIQVAMSRSRGLRYQHPDQFAEDAQSVLAGRPPLHARRLRQQAYDALSEARPASSPAGPPFSIRPWPAIGAVALAFALGIPLGRGLGGPSAPDFADLVRARTVNDAAGWRSYLAEHPRGDGAHEAAAQLGLLTDLERAAAALERQQAEAQHQADELAGRSAAARPLPLPAAQTPPPSVSAPPPGPLLAVTTQSGQAPAVPAAGSPSGESPTVASAAAADAAAAATPAAAPSSPPAPAPVAPAPSARPLPPTPSPRVALTPAGEAALKSAQQRFPFAVSSPVDGLTCHPSDPLQLVAWNRSGSVWHSADGAKTWQAAPLQGGPTTAAATRAWWGVKGKLVFIPATFSDHVGSLSEDGGKTFHVIVRPTAIENGASVHQPVKITLYDRAMLADGELVAVGFVAGDSNQAWNILSSPDRGRTWRSRVVATSVIWSLSPTAVGLLVAAHDPAGGTGGMRVSADLGRNWTPFTGLEGQLMHLSGMLSCTSGNVTVVVDGTSRTPCVYAFTENGKVDEVRELLPIAVSTGQVLRIDAFAIDPLDSRIWYCAGPRIGLLRSLDLGQTWMGYALPGIVPPVGRSSLSFTAAPAPRLVLSTGNEAVIIQDRLHDAALFPTLLPEVLPDPAGARP
jgi:serine/threonine protein kinase